MMTFKYTEIDKIITICLSGIIHRFIFVSYISWAKIDIIYKGLINEWRYIYYE
jgi:hypothetical protein